MQNSSPSPQAGNPTNNNYHNKTDSDALEHKQVSKRINYQCLLYQKPNGFGVGQICLSTAVIIAKLLTKFADLVKGTNFPTEK